MCVFVSAVFGSTLAVFVYKGALTVESGCPLVDHTLLGVGVFDGGVIVGHKVRLREKRKRTKGEKLLVCSGSIQELRCKTKTGNK